MNITTKFTVATEQGLAMMQALTRDLALEQYAGLLDAATLDPYLDKHFNVKTLTAEMNSLANQWLTVYVDNISAGYACITAKGTRPQTLTGKNAIRITGCGVLNAYRDTDAALVLIEKCLSVCKFYENIWLQEFTEHGSISLFERYGFARQQDAGAVAELPLTAAYWIAEVRH